MRVAIQLVYGHGARLIVPIDSVADTIRPEIPTLPTGKHDRATCLRLLEAEMAARRGEGLS